jgi:hypothetical protein
MSSNTFSAIAERSFLLRGPVERTVIAKIGTPEPDPVHPTSFRCPFQVSGLSDDSIQYAPGADSFQALNLAFAGIRSALEKNASVLSAFHEDFSLTWEGGPWQLAIPLWISTHDVGQHERLEQFLQNDFWQKKPSRDA